MPKKIVDDFLDGSRGIDRGGVSREIRKRSTNPMFPIVVM